jgi:AbrB family looped-hinge helix DNA binding protein
METIVSERGHTAVPAAIRKYFNIKKGSRLVWINNGKTIQVIPVPDDPIEALHGIAKGENLLEKLLEERRKDREREETLHS